MEKIFKRPESLNDTISGYCPGCLHGVAHSLIATIIDEMNMKNNTILVLPVGCSCLGAYYWDIDNVNAAHGRAPAVATGVKRCAPDNMVFTYQGDGDLASIGMAEIIHCANRGENITTIFINNSIFGMTGGQMAPTSLIGQHTTTSVDGRKAEQDGYPIDMCKLINQLPAPAYIARFALNTPQRIMQAKKGIKKAFEIQMNKKGYSFVELLSNCPTNWGMKPVDSLAWMEENTLKQFPLGEFRTRGESHGN